MIIKVIQENKSKLILISLILILILSLVYITVFSYRYGHQWIDSDHSSEMVLGKHLSQENAFISTNWFYSSEIRIIYQTIFTMPLFKIFEKLDNWALIRALNILLNNIVYILSYLFLMKSLKIKIIWGLLTSLFLLMPLSLTYWLIVTFGGYYIFFIAQLFCCLGLFVRLVNFNETLNLKRIEFIIFVLLSFLLGLQGIRALLAVHIPLLFACAYLWFGKKKIPVIHGCFGFIACIVGYAANNLLQNVYNFHSFENTKIDNLYTNLLPKLNRSLVTIADFFGLSSGSTYFSISGIFSIAALIVTFLLLWVVFKSIRKVNETAETITGYQFLPTFFAASLIFNICIFIITEQTITPRYFIPFMILYIPLTALFIQYIEINFSYLKRLIAIFTIILFVVGQGCFNFKNFSQWDNNSVRNGYINYLLENKLEFGFATFWNANVTTELTNGKIEIASLRPSQRTESNNNLYSINEHLLPKNYMDPFYTTDKSFLLLESREWSTFTRRWPQIIPDFRDGNFIIIIYPSVEVIHRELLSR